MKYKRATTARGSGTHGGFYICVYCGHVQSSQSRCSLCEASTISYHKIPEHISIKQYPRYIRILKDKVVKEPV